MTETEQQIEQPKPKKAPCAKDTSLFAQIFSAVWIGVLTVLKSLGILKIEMSDIIYSGIAIAGIFMPVYFSLWLEKIRDIRFGNGNIAEKKE